MNGKKRLPPSAEIAYIAVMCALLIGGQYVFSFVAGVEIVTLLLMCFSFVFGARCGTVCAVAFSLLRCAVFGFYPTAVILYLVYYPLLSAAAAGLGRLENEYKSPRAPFIAAVNILLLTLAAACVLCFALDLIKVSRVYKVTVNVLLWLLFSICAALCAAFDFAYISGKKKGGNPEILKTVTAAGVAAVCTVMFTLLDDIITPLFWGYSERTALAYFYASFTAMLPQTVCAAVSVATLFLPLSAATKRAKRI